MSELSALSDAELKALYERSQALSSMSNEQLTKAYLASKRKTAKEEVEGDAISQGARASAANKDGEGISQAALNLLTGAVRGSGSIGATLLSPFDIAKDAIAGKGFSLESNRQRRADMDAALASLGAQTDSLTYKGGKLGAEVGGTLGVGGAVANGIRAVAPASRVADIAATAIESGGFRTGGNMARTADIATRVGGGAVNGGLSAALVNPEDAATGAVIGGLLPPIVKGGAAVADAAWRGARNAASVVSPKAARAVAVDKIAEALGDDAAQAAADIGTHYPKGAEDIPLSAAAITGDARLAQLEQGSRLKDPAAWFEFDQKQGRAVFDNVLMATDEAGNLGERMANRQDNWRTMWATASQNFKPKLWVARMTQFGSDLEQAARAPDASNPAVRGVLDAINSELDRVGPAFSPAHLQQLRANLNGKAQPLSPDVFKSAPRDTPAIKSLIKEMDDILNVSTGGKWQKVLETYTADSDLVRASKAAAKVRSSFLDEATGRVRGTTIDPAGDVPRITEAGLGRAMDAARMPDKSLALSEPANQRLEATVDALRQQNVVQQLKKSATAGGGSDTVPNAIAAGVSSAGAPNFLMQAIGAARKLGSAKTDREIASLLSSPDDLAQALEGWLKPAPQSLVGSGVTGAARALPVGGAALMAPGLSAQQADQPGVVIQPHAHVAAIGTAQSVDEAITAASNALAAPTPRQVADPQVYEAPSAQPVSQIEQRPNGALMESPISVGDPSANEQPTSIWTGRRGAGYLAVEDAMAALKTRQKIEPTLAWRVEKMPDEKFRLAGYARSDAPGLMESAPPQAEMNQSGTATIRDPDGSIRKMLAERGIRSLPMSDGRLLVGTRQAREAFGLLGMPQR